MPRFRDAVKGDLAEIASLKEAPWPSVGHRHRRAGPAGHLGGDRVPHRQHPAPPGLRPLSRICYFMNIVLFGSELHNAAVVQPGPRAPPSQRRGVRRRRAHRACAASSCAAPGMGGAGNPKRPGMPVDRRRRVAARQRQGARSGHHRRPRDDRRQRRRWSTTSRPTCSCSARKPSTEMRPIWPSMGVGAEAERDAGLRHRRPQRPAQGRSTARTASADDRSDRRPTRPATDRWPPR